MRLFYFFLISLFLSLNSIIALQGLASLSDQSFYLAKPFTLTITVTSNKNVQALALPQKNDFLPLNLIKTTKEKKSNKDQSIYLYHFDLQCFSPEENRIPTLNFLLSSQQQRHNITLPSIRFPLKSHFNDEEKDNAIISQIYDSLNIEFEKRWLLRPLLGLLGLISIITLIILIFKKKKAKQINQVKNHLTPLEEALLNLDNLKKQHLFKHQKYKEHYSQLSHILKQFLSRTFQLNLLDRTSKECLILLEAHCEEFHLKKIKSLLQMSDYVKFAKTTPLERQEIESIEQFQVFILKIHTHLNVENTEAST